MKNENLVSNQLMKVVESAQRGTFAIYTHNLILLHHNLQRKTLFDRSLRKSDRCKVRY